MRKPVIVEVDSVNLHILLSAPVTCTLLLTKILKLKPKLCAGVTSCLTEPGVWNENIYLKEVLHNLSKIEIKKRVQIQVPVHKVGEYNAKDEGNTTLPIEMARIVSIAILDNELGSTLLPNLFGKNGVNLQSKARE